MRKVTGLESNRSLPVVTLDRRSISRNGGSNKQTGPYGRRTTGDGGGGGDDVVVIVDCTEARLPGASKDRHLLRRRTYGQHESDRPDHRLSILGVRRTA